MKKDFNLDGIVPWGRTRDEYFAFFGLSEGDLLNCAPILDVGAGPSSFTAEIAAAGVEVVAVDPVYRTGCEQIRARFEAVRPALEEGMRRAAHRFVWDSFATPADVVRHRRLALDRFLGDFEAGKRAGRYQVGELPDLPFAADTFGLALCSHLLFLYSDELDEAFHLSAISELLRLASEARIYPLVDMEGEPSRHLEPVIRALRAQDVNCALVEVPYRIQQGAAQMLQLRRRA
jgi:SAM-dependent methyltransferase